MCLIQNSTSDKHIHILADSNNVAIIQCGGHKILKNNLRMIQKYYVTVEQSQNMQNT